MGIPLSNTELIILAIVFLLIIVVFAIVSERGEADEMKTPYDYNYYVWALYEHEQRRIECETWADAQRLYDSFIYSDDPPLKTWITWGEDGKIIMLQKGGTK